MSFIRGRKSVFLVSLSLFAFLALALSSSAQVNCDTSIDNVSDDRALQAILEQCEKEIEEQTKELKEVQKEKTTIESGIATLNIKINKSKTAISTHNIRIKKLGGQIEEKNAEIGSLERRTERVKKSLANLVQETNELENRSIMEAMLSAENLSDFFVDVDSIEALKDGLQDKLIEIRDLKGQTQEAKDVLKDSQSKEQSEKFLREKEKKQTEAFKGEKQRILKGVKEEEKEYKTIIAEKEAKKRAILSRILNIGGGRLQITFGDALKLIQPYEAQIGVDAALVLAVLTQESGVNGVIGGNLGKCTYNQAWRNNAGTVMSNSQKKAFLSITSELGLNPDKTPVSCPIPRDGSYGGAMGAAQFMPNTWLGFRNRIARVIGVPFASPFENKHAFVGTMLYLSDAMVRCRPAFSTEFKENACAAGKYYSGLASKGARLARHMNPKSSYGYRVASRAAQFAKDIEFLSL